MNKETIIQNEVKANFSEFGLNEDERKSFESLILEQIKDKTFEKEEDLKTEIGTMINGFKPSAKLLQQSRTKLMQENAKVLKEFEEYKKRNPEKAPEPEPEPEKGKEVPEWAKALLDEVKNLKELQEAEKKQRTASEKKQAVLKALKPKYNKSFHTTIDVIANAFDFNNEDAETKLTEQISQLAKDNPAMLVDGNGGDKDKKKNNPFMLDKNKDNNAQEEFNKELI